MTSLLSLPRSEWDRTRGGHRPHSTTGVPSWSGRGRDRAPAASCRRRTACPTTAPCRPPGRRAGPPPASGPTQLLSVEQSRVTPCRDNICAWRYSGSESQNLLTTTCAISASVAMRPSVPGAKPEDPLRRRGDDHGALAGAAAIMGAAGNAHPQLGGRMSTCSVRSSSIACSAPPQQGQSRLATSTTTS